MGDIDVLTVTLALAGVIILYGAIKNKNPLEVLKLTLQGKDINLAKPLATANSMTQVVTGQPNVDPSEFHSDGTPRAYPNGTARYVGDPLPSALPPTDTRNKFKSIVPPGTPGDPRAPKDARRPVSFIAPFATGNSGGFV